MPEPSDSEIFHNLSAVEEAEHRAFRRGQAQANLESKLEHHFKDDDRRFGELKSEQERTTNTLGRVVEKVDDLGGEIKTAAAVTTARATDAKAAAEKAEKVAAKQLSTRTFLLGIAGTVAAIFTALAASGHL